MQVRDDKGRKMSKSLGNVVDPLDVISQYSCDALRFTLATGAADRGVLTAVLYSVQRMQAPSGTSAGLPSPQSGANSGPAGRASAG